MAVERARVRAQQVIATGSATEGRGPGDLASGRARDPA
jgi:hypothetical protein